MKKTSSSFFRTSGVTGHLGDVWKPFADGFNTWVQGLTGTHFPKGCERNAGEPCEFMDLGVTEVDQDLAQLRDLRDCCFHGQEPTVCGRLSQPDAAQFLQYRIRMRRDSKQILWENVRSLMNHKFQKENVNGFANYVEIGVGSVLRIREQQTSVGLDIVDKIAKKFSLESWQLLVPGLEVDNPPMLATDSERMKQLFSRFKNSVEALSGELRETGNTEPGTLDELEERTSKRKKK